MSSTEALTAQSTNNALERKIQELTVLYEISQLFVCTPDTRDALGEVLNLLNAKMGMKRGTVTLFDNLTHELRIEAAHGLTP